MDVPGPADHRVKLAESEKKDKGIGKKMWNMNVSIISIAIGALGTVNKLLIPGLEELKIRGREETIQTTASLR